ncbi:MAG: polyphosphate kinase 1 [Verrucomicrobiota bacterium]|nr:polyphosphate kinase 1 [Verrucomicrobiota bacterium]
MKGWSWTMEATHYINRELSWLEFNQRVLEEASDSHNPLLERLKFFCIVSSNLDEFFEVRVASLKEQVSTGLLARGPDGRTPAETLRAVTRRVRRMVDLQYGVWREELLPQLKRKGIRLLRCDELTERQLKWADGYYDTEVHPVLTPLSIDPSHPFPLLLNKSLNIIVELEAQGKTPNPRQLAVVQVPRNLPRLVPFKTTRTHRDYLYLGEIIYRHLERLFPGNRILGHWMFRVTRNSELYLDEESISDMLMAMEEELDNRRKGDAVRLEVTKGCPPHVRNRLLQELELTKEDLYTIEGPLNPTQFMQVYEGSHCPELRDKGFMAPMAFPFRNKERGMFEVIRQKDVLLHHPYESFQSVVHFIENAANDPKVLAIKLTMYRAGSDQEIFKALMRAVRNDKQVTVVMELKARFDENNNIKAARQLEKAGVHVLYGLAGYKIHCKMCLVVRKDDDGIRRYVHLGSGNYNPSTAKIYTDVALFSARAPLGRDVNDVFNLLTGVCQFQGTEKLIVAPFNLHDTLLAKIRREAENARKGIPARIIAKMNALVDTSMMDALCDASKHGVQIDLIIRGICCLRPGLKGISEHIRVRSVVGRFLEHSRIFYFENGCQPEVYVGSADWMPRNFFRRIEVLFPVEDGILRDRLTHELLEVYLEDNTKARWMKSDGSYHRPIQEDGSRPLSSQAAFMDLSLKTNLDSMKHGVGRKKRHRKIEVKRTP